MSTKKTIKAQEKAIAKAVETLEELIQKFDACMKQAINSLIDAAKVYNTAVDTYGDDASKAFKERFPQWTKKDWKILILIARKEASPKLFTVVKQQVLRTVGSLSYERQVEILGEVGQAMPAIPVLSRGSVKEKTVEEMNSTELSSAIDVNADRVRTMEEQIAAANAKAAEKIREAAANPDWVLKDGVLTVCRVCSMKGTELKKLYLGLKQMFEPDESVKL